MLTECVWRTREEQKKTEDGSGKRCKLVAFGVARRGDSRVTENEIWHAFRKPEVLYPPFGAEKRGTESEHERASFRLSLSARELHGGRALTLMVLGFRAELNIL